MSQGSRDIFQQEGDSIQVNGIELYFETVGRGEPLLLLHGFTQSGRIWEPVIGELAKNFQLIIPDLRGHGASTNPSGEFTHNQSALDIIALLDHLGHEHTKAVGFSSGGHTLLHLASQEKDRLAAMVLVGAAPYFPEQTRNELRKLDPSNLPEGEMKRLCERHSLGEPQALALLDQFKSFSNNRDDMNFTPERLNTIKVRTMIVYGDRDEFFPVRLALELYENIEQSYLCIIPNANHDPTFGPNLQYFLNILTQFLKDRWRAPSSQ
jgi:pimeloyl-ACP methyl ester carboxylesterase